MVSTENMAAKGRYASMHGSLEAMSMMKERTRRTSGTYRTATSAYRTTYTSTVTPVIDSVHTKERNPDGTMTSKRSSSQLELLQPQMCREASTSGHPRMAKTTTPNTTPDAYQMHFTLRLCSLPRDLRALGIRSSRSIPLPPPVMPMPPPPLPVSPFPLLLLMLLLPTSSYSPGRVIRRTVRRKGSSSSPDSLSAPW